MANNTPPRPTRIEILADAALKGLTPLTPELQQEMEADLYRQFGPPPEAKAKDQPKP